VSQSVKKSSPMRRIGFVIQLGCALALVAYLLNLPSNEHDAQRDALNAIAQHAAQEAHDTSDPAVMASASSDASENTPGRFYTH
jgi:hypothetical protein